MELTEVAVAASKMLHGKETLVDLLQGTTLKVKLEGNDLLSSTVPHGKKWNVVIFVQITETEA